MLLVAALVTDILIALTTKHGERVAVGCNLHDALVIGMECRGFAGAGVAEIVLNLPFWLIYYPVFAFVSLWALVASVILWAPLMFLIFAYRRRKNAT